MSEPQRFGKYLLYERIAVGGMAEVFRARPVASDDLLALKRIHPHHLENDDFVSMLIDEAKISVQLNHPNVIQVVDLGRVENHYFIAMEFIRGRDLRRVMERLAENGRPFPVEAAVSIIASVARGLDYAHGKSDARGKKMEIVHRDISPQNVLVGFDGIVKVIDFGIAKAAGRLMETQVGILKGKYAYMSPEQAAGGTLDHRTDIFSTGIMLYECAVGKHPFRATHDIETLRNIKNSSFTDPHAANPDVPRAIERVILKALAPKKEDRYFTAGAMADDLEAALQKIAPGYGRDQLSEWVSGLFADEIASGAVPEAASPAEKSSRAKASARLLGPSGASAQSQSVSQSATIAAPARVGKRPQQPVTLAPQSTAMVVSKTGIAQVWATTRDGVQSFVARIQAGKLTTADSVVLGILSVAFLLLALLILMWDPAKGARRGPAAPVPAAARGNAAAERTAPTTDAARAAAPAHPAPAAKSGSSAAAGDARFVPSGTLTVYSIPGGAEVRVDGVFKGRTPLSVNLPEGDHSLLVRDRSGAEEPRSVHIRGGGKAVERFKLQ